MRTAKRDHDAVDANSPDQELTGMPGSADQADDSWHTVIRANKRRNKRNYPALTHSPNARLNSAVKISDLQNLVLYLLADGSAPQWISVQHHHDFQKAVVLMVPGLDAELFNSHLSTLSPHPVNEPHQVCESLNVSPDHYYPTKLDPEKLPPALRPLSDIFAHIWPIRTPGDNNRMHSPLGSMLTSALPKPKDHHKKKGPRPPVEGKNWIDAPTPVTSFVATRAELCEHGFAVHPVHLETDTERQNEISRRHKNFQGQQDGWIDLPDDTDHHLTSLLDTTPGSPEGDLLDCRQVLVLDCEMVTTTTDKFALARASLVDWHGNTVLDELIKPPDPITDYLTQYSGITPALLEPVTLTLAGLHDRLRTLLTPTTILAGHSLDSDLRALKIAYPFVIDTSILYPHPKGPPTKSSLKWLCDKYLGRQIQTHGGKGHDSVEDALSCLHLIRQKCEKGKLWGTPEATNESILRRLARSVPVVGDCGKDTRATRPGKIGAIVDWGDPMRGFGATASLSIACESDEDVVQGVRRAVSGDSTTPACDFVWARLRELEALRGWWNKSKTDDAQDRLERVLAAADQRHETNNLEAAAAKTADCIRRVWESLPERTAFIVYSGSGDPREMSRLLKVHADFKKAYQTMKWDELPVKWTDTEEQALQAAAVKARSGIGFLAVSRERDGVWCAGPVVAR